MASVYKRTARNGKPAKRWTALYYDAEQRKHRTKSAHADKQSSLVLAKRLERISAQKAEGIIDPVEELAARPIRQHLEDFLTTEIDTSRNARYRHQIRARLERVIDGVGAGGILDLHTVEVSRFLDGLLIKGRALSPATRSDYVATLKRFTDWALRSGLIPRDPLATLKSPGRPPAQAVHPRRSLTNDEVARLLDAARRRPLLELQTIRTGPDRGKRIAKVSAHAAARANSLGEERRAVYLAARWTGLRRSELRDLRWSDVYLDGDTPHFRLRARATKAKRADAVVLHPQVVEVLEQRRPAEASGERVFRTIPDMKALRADLKLAGINYGDIETGFADFHALRVTCNTLTAIAGMSQRARQAHLRHTHPRLTEVVYTDERLLPVAEELRRLPAV